MEYGKINKEEFTKIVEDIFKIKANLYKKSLSGTSRPPSNIIQDEVGHWEFPKNKELLDRIKSNKVCYSNEEGLANMEEAKKFYRQQTKKLMFARINTVFLNKKSKQ